MKVPTIYSQEAKIAWAPPPSDQQNGILRRYIVNVTSADSGEELIAYSQATTTLVQDLDPFTTYFCSVSAETVAPGPFSLPVMFRTAEEGEVLHCNIIPNSILTVLDNHCLFVICLSTGGTK